MRLCSPPPPTALGPGHKYRVADVRVSAWHKACPERVMGKKAR